MRNFFTTILLLFWGFSFSIAQKQTLLSVKAGYHLTMVKGIGTSNFESKWGYHGGLGFEYVFSNPLGLKTEFLYETRSFANYSNTINSVINKQYYDDVKQTYLHIPVLLTYHFKTFSIEFGPNCDFLVHSKQVETTYQTTWYDEYHKKDTIIIKYDQRSFYNTSIGINLGVNYNIYDRINLSAGFTQYFTNVGIDYLWKKYSFLKFSLGYSFGKKYEYRVIAPEEKNATLKDYAITRKYGFTAAEFQKTSDANKIIIHLYRINNKYEINNVAIEESSGVVHQNASQIIIDYAQYPFKGKITLSLKQKTSYIESESVIEFEIYKEGTWNIVLSQ